MPEISGARLATGLEKMHEVKDAPVKVGLHFPSVGLFHLAQGWTLGEGGTQSISLLWYLSSHSTFFIIYVSSG